MSRGIQPGDLCVIVGSVTNPETNGAVVEVVSRFHGSYWLVRGKWIEDFARRAGAMQCAVDERRLRRIDDGGEDTTTPTTTADELLADGIAHA